MADFEGHYYHASGKDPTRKGCGLKVVASFVGGCCAVYITIATITASTTPYRDNAVEPTTLFNMASPRNRLARGYPQGLRGLPHLGAHRMPYTPNAFNVDSIVGQNPVARQAVAALEAHQRGNLAQARDISMRAAIELVEGEPGKSYRYLPIEINGEPKLLIKGDGMFECVAKKGIGYRFSKDLEDRDTIFVGPEFGQVFKGEPAGENWVKVKVKEAAAEVAKAPSAGPLKIQDMAGVLAPTGFFDPLGLSTDIPEGKLRFYREVELKHGRVAMLASLGILVGEQFHPLFGGNIDVPAYVAFQQTPLQTFWPFVVFAIAIPEVFSVATFKEPSNENDSLWAIRSDHVPGDLGFDPLGLKPTDPKEFKELQTKELNNGRLAMIATAGMIAQELATGKKLF